MGIGRGLLRRALFGALVAGFVLAMSVPGVALAYSAKFSHLIPHPGSVSASSARSIRVDVYDRFGVRYKANYSISIDGVKKSTSIRYRPGFGYRWFTLTYSTPTLLSAGTHRVTARVHDLKHNTSTSSWSFVVTPDDLTAPVTTSNAVLEYSASATILLFATDNAGGSGVANTYYMLDGGPAISGTAAFTSVLGAHTLEYWSVDRAGNVETHHVVSFALLGASFAHAAPENACTAIVGCHGGLDTATIHWAVKCTPCHAPGVTATNDCLSSACHGPNGPHTGAHAVIPSSGTPACTQATCHGTDVVIIHTAGCGECHASTNATVVAAIAAGGATCETCHTSMAVAHPAIGTRHTVSGICYTPECHASTDVGVIHTQGDDPPGCWVCHGPGKTPSLDCANTTCHPNFLTVHSFTHADATGTKSSACVACHGTDLPIAHNGVFTGQPSAGCVCHTASFLRAEMTPLLASGHAECVDCHKDTHAAHSFNETASGHSTTTYGKKGVYTKFDGTQGVTLIDTEDDTVTTAWDFPTANVFWSSTDPSAPPTAIKGLTKDSVVTCQDCHTGLNAAGPHGAAQNWAIDPNYDYPFKYAILGGPAGARSFTDPALNYRASGVATGAATPATLSAGVPASASGIKARIASNLSTSTNAPVQIKSTNPADLMITNYNNYPDGRGAEYIADATSGQYAVICAKCHDLYNYASLPTTNAVDNGWGNAGPDSYEGMHGAHAGGTARNGNDLGRIDGRSDCASCHVAIPHAWSQPRLLVNGFTGNYYIGGGWSGGVLNPGTPTPSVADPYPYFQGRGMPFSTGVGVMAPAPAVSPGNGPNDAKDNHAFNAFGKPVWEEAACISCSGAFTGTALEHRGLTTEPAKLR